jgi:hypothetical protein
VSVTGVDHTEATSKGRYWRAESALYGFRPELDATNRRRLTTRVKKEPEPELAVEFGYCFQKPSTHAQMMTIVSDLGHNKLVGAAIFAQDLADAAADANPNVRLSP